MQEMLDGLQRSSCSLQSLLAALDDELQALQAAIGGERLHASLVHACTQLMAADQLQQGPRSTQDLVARLGKAVKPDPLPLARLPVTVYDVEDVVGQRLWDPAMLDSALDVQRQLAPRAAAVSGEVALAVYTLLGSSLCAAAAAALSEHEVRATLDQLRQGERVLHRLSKLLADSQRSRLRITNVQGLCRGALTHVLSPCGLQVA